MRCFEDIFPYLIYLNAKEIRNVLDAVMGIREEKERRILEKNREKEKKR